MSNYTSAFSRVGIAPIVAGINTVSRGAMLTGKTMALEVWGEGEQPRNIRPVGHPKASGGKVCSKMVEVVGGGW